MSSQTKRLGILLSLAVAFILACNVSVAPGPTQQPAYDPTKMALEFQATMMSQQLTQSALNAQQQPPPAQPTSPPPQVQVTVIVPPADTPIPPTPTEDVEAKIKSANVLVYENTDALGIGMWVQDALDGMGIKYTQTGSYSGHFMEYLNSGKKYDLIIVDAEDKAKITGEFWDVINTRLTRDKAALIVEIWYLQRESRGPIDKILSACGVRYRKAYQLADSIYWWDSTHPVFNEPNTVLPLLHYARYWGNGAGDQIRLGGSGDATMLAGLSSRPSDEGVLATCFGGRVIIQTFSDHDYRAGDIVPLWQNYIHYTLKNHFLQTQQ